MIKAGTQAYLMTQAEGTQSYMRQYMKIDLVIFEHWNKLGAKTSGEPLFRWNIVSLPYTN